MIKNINKLLHSLPIILIITIIGTLSIGHLVPLFIQRFFFTFSLFFKEFLGLLIPFIVFSFVFTGIIGFKKNAPLVLAVLIGSIFLSNCFVALIAYTIMRIILPFIVPPTYDISTTGAALIPYVVPSFPLPIRSDLVLIATIIIGIFLSCIPIPFVEKSIIRLKHIVQAIVNYCVIPLIPFYLVGFLFNMQHQGIITQLFSHYSLTYLTIVLIQWGYLLLMYYIANAGAIQNTLNAVYNALPSYFTALSTMSSTATIPISIQCAEKNIGTNSLAHIAMPIMANVHLIGDSITTPALALVTTSLFLDTIPTIGEYIIFVGYFSLTMLAASGIPGGGIIVMIPLLTHLFKFTPEMISIITALYMLQDPIGTAGNVMGDGALVIIVHRILQWLGIRENE